MIRDIIAQRSCGPCGRLARLAEAFCQPPGCDRPPPTVGREGAPPLGQRQPKGNAWLHQREGHRVCRRKVPRRGGPTPGAASRPPPTAQGDGSRPPPRPSLSGRLQKCLLGAAVPLPNASISFQFGRDSKYSFQLIKIPGNVILQGWQAPSKYYGEPLFN